MTAVTSSTLIEAFEANKGHVINFCCAPTESLKGWNDQWAASVSEAFIMWAGQQNVTWESYAQAWTEFVQGQDGSFTVILECGCHPLKSCDKCGPVKGKVRGVVYLRKIKDDKYFIAP